MANISINGLTSQQKSCASAYLLAYCKLKQTEKWNHETTNHLVISFVDYHVTGSRAF